MKNIIFLVPLFMSTIAMSQLAGTSFEQPEVFSVQYVDTGDATVAHDLVNNPDEPYVDFAASGGEIGYNARYEPYDTPSDGLTDGDLVGVTELTPSSDLPFTDGTQGYHISDTDGNFILEFDTLDLSGTTAPGVTMDIAIAVNGDGSNGNYEGDGTVNASSSDRLRIYVKDVTLNTEIDLINSTGSDLDDLVPTDPTTGNYILAWQNLSASLTPDSQVQLVVEFRCNAGGEAVFIDNVVFTGTLGNPNIAGNNITILPNPAHDFITLKGVQAGAMEVTLFDVLGKEVMSSTIASEGIDISRLTSGVYFVQIAQENHIEIKKLVIR